MKSIGLIILLISVAIVAFLGLKQKKTTLNKTTIAPSGKEVQITELPTEIKGELDQINKQTEKRLEGGQKEE
jgi:hypothetical protein